jgi:fumarate hydratase class I
MADFIFQELLPLETDSTAYRLLTPDFVSAGTFEGAPMLKIAPEGLTLLAQTAFKEVSHFYRGKHIRQLADILKDPEASDNDRYVALEMVKNAVIAAEGLLPLCQDTGTAVVIGKKGQQVWTGYQDSAALARGIFQAYTQNYFRYSQNAALSMYEEQNTGNNLPAQIDLYAVPGAEYRFLFIAKGGGSSNKTFLFQETKAILNPDSLIPFMTAKMKALGTAACPPYHLAFVVGGTSPETNLKVLKMATAGYLDSLPQNGNELGRAFRDPKLEEQLLKISQASGIGAQFGGKYFCLDVRVIRLPRHGASCPISLGVSCSADRNVKAKITTEGIFLEQLETNPARFLPQPAWQSEKAVPIDLEQPMDRIRAILTQYPVATALKLNGRIIVARDIAHAKLKERLDQGEDLPQYFKDHIIFYAGPAKTPPGYASGSLGPTTAGRMDAYVPIFQQKGGSLIMLAKGNRTPLVREACQKYGGFYLGSIGGPAARLAKECIQKMEIISYPELGMEAIFMITVKDFPAFIITDDKGHDFFDNLLK